MELLGRELWLVLGGFRQCRSEIPRDDALTVPRQRIEALGGFWGALTSVIPELEGAAHVDRRFCCKPDFLDQGRRKESHFCPRHSCNGRGTRLAIPARPGFRDNAVVDVGGNC
jgi:hypothetical protein